MKTYDQRARDIRTKLLSAKRRRKAVIGVVSMCCCLALIAGIGLIPKDTPVYKGPPEVVLQAQGYDPLISKLSVLLENHKDINLGIPENEPTATPGGVGPTDRYEEITDNQVQGVTEADLIKRSDKHIYYLRGNTLTAYSIDKENSKALGSYDVGSELGEDYRVYSADTRMYLSMDCKTVVILTSCYQKQECQRYVYLLSLDVTDPEHPQVSGSRFITGDYNTSRMVEGELYVISRLYVKDDADFEDKSTFLPGYGTKTGITYLPMENIHIPEEPTDAMYTMVTKLDAASMEVKNSVALLSSTGSVYMSKENIYLTRGYSHRIDEDSKYTIGSMTEITRLDASLNNKGTFCVRGSVKDQYSLDEYDGCLRVVTGISETVMEEYSDGQNASVSLVGSTTNAGLYCIDLRNHSIRAKVECFAPEGERVRSVRFDGNAAYVCTSIVLQDPVFFFDLSDLDNIRYKDTGTIDGYSMSLVDFAEGFLMGIGYGDNFDILKIEMYREGATSVESHCAYERLMCGFSGDYKSYYIDRENQLIGMGIWDYVGDTDGRYILLHFDGYQFVTLLEVARSGALENVRAVYIDGYFYLFDNEFRVEKVN